MRTYEVLINNEITNECVIIERVDIGKFVYYRSMDIVTPNVETGIKIANMLNTEDQL